MLGHKLTQVLSLNPKFELFATCRTLPDETLRFSRVNYISDVHLTSERCEKDLENAIAFSNADVVLNSAGAIKQKDLNAAFHETLFLNSMVPHWLAIKLSAIGKKLIHISTDCVFDGKSGNYAEKTLPNVVDLYGRSKAIGEVNYGSHLTLRTSIIGFETQGFLSLLSWFLLHPEESQISGFSRAIYSGLPTVRLAREIENIMLNNFSLSGLFHVASEPISKLKLLEMFASKFELKRNICDNPAFAIDRSLDDTLFRTATKTVRPGWGELMSELYYDFNSIPYSRIYNKNRNIAL